MLTKQISKQDSTQFINVEKPSTDPQQNRIYIKNINNLSAEAKEQLYEIIKKYSATDSNGDAYVPQHVTNENGDKLNLF